MSPERGEEGEDPGAKRSGDRDGEVGDEVGALVLVGEAGGDADTGAEEGEGGEQAELPSGARGPLF